MNVKLIALTQPTIYDGGDDGDNALMDTEQLIAYCARVSNPSNQLNHGSADKLLRYLTEHQHWSPFEMAHAVIEIETTRDIARQILRHRSFSFQEFSQRYAEVQDQPVIRETRLQDAKNRQSSVEVDDSDLDAKWQYMQSTAVEQAQRAYDWALDNGIAKEVARVVLPEGMTPSRLYMSGTIRSWLHYVQLRTGNGTQKEHRAIAMACRDVLLERLPSLGGLLS